MAKVRKCQLCGGGVLENAGFKTIERYGLALERWSSSVGKLIGDDVAAHPACAKAWAKMIRETKKQIRRFLQKGA